MLDQEKLETATQYYQEGDFETAAALFDELTVENPSNPYILINSGNSHYQLKEYGLATKAFLKAKKIAPRSKELANNLGLLQNEIKLEQPSLVSYSYMSFAESLILVILLNIVFLMRKKLFASRPSMSFVINLFFIISVINAGFIGLNQKSQPKAVVSQISTMAYSGNSTSFSELFELLDGQIVFLMRQEDEWSQIKYSGEIGWVKNEDIEII